MMPSCTQVRLTLQSLLEDASWLLSEVAPDGHDAELYGTMWEFEAIIDDARELQGSLRRIARDGCAACPTSSCVRAADLQAAAMRLLTQLDNLARDDERLTADGDAPLQSTRELLAGFHN